MYDLTRRTKCRTKGILIKEYTNAGKSVNENVAKLFDDGI